MAKIRIYYCFWFVLEYTVVFVSGKTERLTLCEDFERKNVSFGCTNNETIILDKITYGESLCQDTSNNDICHSNISSYFNNHCHGNTNCILSTEKLFNENCKRPPRRLYVNFTCNWIFLYNSNHNVLTCANSLREVKCTHFQHIDIENVKSDSECRGIDTTNATARLKELCDDKRTCSPDTDYDSSLYHERFVSFSYGCTGPTDSQITKYTPSTSSDNKLDVTTITTANDTVDLEHVEVPPILSFDKDHRIEIDHPSLKQKLYLCSYGWDNQDAGVLCKSLNKTWTGHAVIVEKLLDLEITNNSLDCNGLEASLFECNYTEDEQGCNTGEVAGAICCQGTDRAGECFTNTSAIIPSIESQSSRIVDITVIVVSSLVVTIVATIVIIVIVCQRKKRAQHSKLCLTHNITTATDRTNTSYYNIINLNQMTDIGIFPINDNTSETPATQHQQQNITTANEHDRNMGNKYDSISVNRNSDEHLYDSDPIHINQYESLTKPRESDKHTYESTEQALPQNINTPTEQEDNICNKYETLSTNRNTVEHVYESDSIRINQYESLTKQRESDKHTYESTEQALPQIIKTLVDQEENICNKYESLSINRTSDRHIYESDSTHTNKYESLTTQRESDKHNYEFIEPT